MILLEHNSHNIKAITLLLGLLLSSLHSKASRTKLIWLILTNSFYTSWFAQKKKRKYPSSSHSEVGMMSGGVLWPSAKSLIIKEDIFIWDNKQYCSANIWWKRCRLITNILSKVWNAKPFGAVFCIYMFKISIIWKFPTELWVIFVLGCNQFCRFWSKCRSFSTKPTKNKYFI